MTLPILLCASVLLYPASNSRLQVEAEGRTVSVRGDWDLSPCGELRFEFAAEDAPAAVTVCKVMLANEGAVLPDREYHHSEGVYAATALLKPGQRSFVLPIPPAMPEFQSVVRKLHAVDVTGLFYLIWPHPMWTYKEAGGGNNIYSWTLDARKVVSCTVSCPWKPGVKPVRIEATGTANAVVSWPDFAKRTPEEFFPFIDRYGQFKWRDWPGKIHGDAELKASIAAEDADLAAHPAPADHDKWGGWKVGPRFEATGAFYVKKVDGKWWFVDPDGRLWWSHGPLRVSPSCGMTPVRGCGHPKTPYFGREHYFEELPTADSPLAAFYRTRDELMWPYYIRYGVTNTYDFTSANLYRKHGAGWLDIWADRVHRRLRSWGANTIANSSDIRVMRLSRTPYCDRFELKSRSIAGTEKLHGWWPFRDPFDPSFVAYVREQMAAHKAEMDDPWCFGFFVDNELTWGKPGDLARWTWESPDDQPAKAEFKRRLAAKYGRVPETPSDGDFNAFSLEIAEAYFRNVRDTFKACAPKKLYMGCRFSGAPETVVRIAAKYVDVMSYNYYERDVKGFNRLPVDIDKPVIIGEFHFGSLDRGPFRPGLVMTRDQVERGEIYRRYLTSALEDPRFVGVHWHQYADDVATGRFDGENLQNGWVDICDNPYPETIEAVRWVGANMYRIRAAAKGTDVSCPSGTVATVDFAKDVGMLKRLNGVCNAPPLSGGRGHRVAELARELETPMCRFHDAALENPGMGLVDVSRVFPLFHADADDPRNYDFTATDDYLRQCVDAGVEMEFRLGESIEHSVKQYRVHPPADFAKWAEICAHIVRHYNEGWADGFRWNIRHWSLWEEPDTNPMLLAGPDAFERYLKLYAVTVRRLKREFPGIRVCGPQSCNNPARLRQFVDYCATNALPVDVLGWTAYCREPEAFGTTARLMREYLDAHGFAKTRTALAEWHYGPTSWSNPDQSVAGRRRYADDRRADLTGVDSTAFTAATLIAMQDAPIDRMFFYNMKSPIWGLFDASYNPLGSYFSMKAFAQLAHGRIRVLVDGSGKGLYVLATKGTDCVGRLLVAAFKRPSTPKILIRGGFEPTSVRLIDGTHELAPVADWRWADGRLTLACPQKGSAVWLIEGRCMVRE